MKAKMLKRKAKTLNIKAKNVENGGKKMLKIEVTNAEYNGKSA